MTQARRLFCCLISLVFPGTSFGAGTHRKILVAHGNEDASTRIKLDVSQIGDIVKDPPEELQVQLEAESLPSSFRRVSRQHDDGRRRPVWYGETDESPPSSMHPFPFITTNNKGKKMYVGIVHVGQHSYDNSVDAMGQHHVTKHQALDFDEEDDPVPGDNDDPARVGRNFDARKRNMLRSNVTLSHQGVVTSSGDDSIRDIRRLSNEIVNLRIIVGWTQKAECWKSEMKQNQCTLNQTTWDLMNAHANLAVEMTNTAFVESGVHVELELVYTFRVNDYREPPGDSFSFAMNALKGTTDGFMDYVHVERERYQAQLVSLLIEAPGSCGRGKRGPIKHEMFSVVQWRCATNSLTFAHEVGHNFGCGHDRGTDNQCESTGYAFGWRDPQVEFRTIMSKSCRSDQCDKNAGGGCPRIPRFSTSDKLYNGKATGSIINDCARRINEKRFEVCEFYTCGPIPTPPTPSPTVSLAPTLTQILGGDCELPSGGIGSWAHFTIQTDAWGEETSWDLFDKDGKLIAFHDIRSYFDNYLHERYICVPPGPLTFTIKDAHGDGITADGYYQLCTDETSNCVRGSKFGDRETQILGRLTKPNIFSPKPPEPTKSPTVSPSVSPSTSPSKQQSSEVEYSLKVSYNSDRSNAFELEGQHFSTSDEVYIFTYPEEGVKNVVFFQKDQLIQKEKWPPYDLGGARKDATAYPWNLSVYTAGAHQMNAVENRDDKFSIFITATYVVEEQ